MNSPHFFNCHTHFRDNSEIAIVNINIADIDGSFVLPDHRYYSIGLHPWNASTELWEKAEPLFDRILQNKSIKAIGETGIDKLRGNSVHEQQKIFVLHAELAEQYDKPLIIHCVRAYNEIIELKKSFKQQRPWIIHGFNTKSTIADKLWKHGFILSFGASICKPDSHVKEILKNAPNNGFFLENDDSTMPITDIYECAATIRQSSVDDLKNIVWDNAHNVFFEKGRS